MSWPSSVCVCVCVRAFSPAGRKKGGEWALIHRPSYPPKEELGLTNRCGRCPNQKGRNSYSFLPRNLSAAEEEGSRKWAEGGRKGKGETHCGCRIAEEEGGGISFVRRAEEEP